MKAIYFHDEDMQHKQDNIPQDPNSDGVTSTFDLGEPVVVDIVDHEIMIDFDSRWFIIMTDDDIEEIVAIYLD